MSITVAEQAATIKQLMANLKPFIKQHPCTTGNCEHMFQADCDDTLLEAFGYQMLKGDRNEY